MQFLDNYGKYNNYPQEQYKVKIRHVAVPPTLFASYYAVVKDIKDTTNQYFVMDFTDKEMWKALAIIQSGDSVLTITRSYDDILNERFDKYKSKSQVWFVSSIFMFCVYLFTNSERKKYINTKKTL